MGDVKEYPEVYDHFHRPPEAFEKVSDESITETAGYVPADRQIEDMMLAGKRLNEARAAQYDFPEGNDDGEFFDPTRSPAFDLADVSRLSRDVNNRLEKQAKEASEAKNKVGSGPEVPDPAQGQEKPPEVK